MEMLRELLEKAMAVDLSSAKSTNDPIAEGEELVGVMSEEAQRLWVVYDQLFKTQKAHAEPLAEKVRAICKKDKAIRTPEEISFLNELVFARQKVDLTKEAFWCTVYQQFPQVILDSRSIGVRADWKIVFLKPKERSSAGHIIIMGAVEPCGCDDCVCDGCCCD